MKRALWLLLISINAHAAATYRLDADHVRVTLDVTRMGIQLMTARFGVLSGEFVVDRVGLESRVEVSLSADSIESPDRKWNEKIRSKDWLDPLEFPEITYHSNQIGFDGQERSTAHGQLTMRGITKPLTLNISRLACPDDPSNPAQRCEFTGHATFRRSDFGLPHGLWLAGDDVRISIDGTGVLQPDP